MYRYTNNSFPVLFLKKYSWAFTVAKMAHATCLPERGNFYGCPGALLKASEKNVAESVPNGPGPQC